MQTRIRSRADITRSFNLHNPIVEGTVNQKAFAALVARGRDVGNKAARRGNEARPWSHGGNAREGNASDKKKKKGKRRREKDEGKRGNVKGDVNEKEIEKHRAKNGEK